MLIHLQFYTNADRDVINRSNRDAISIRWQTRAEALSGTAYEIIILAVICSVNQFGSLDTSPHPSNYQALFCAGSW